MDDDKLTFNLNIDPQKDFNPAASSDGLSTKKIKDYLKDIDFEKLTKAMPLKNMRHTEPLINAIHLPPLDQSGSMGSILAHEMPHGKVYKADKIFEKDYDAYNKKIIILDEIEKGGEAFSKKISEFFNDVTVILDSYQTSQARGEELAEGFQTGVAQPVAVRRPLSFRPRAGFVA